jgi:hypothetical protein
MVTSTNLRAGERASLAGLEHNAFLAIRRAFGADVKPNEFAASGRRVAPGVVTLQGELE